MAESDKTAPSNTMNMEQDSRVKSSISLVSELEHEETVKHSKYHKYNGWCLVIILLISICSYISYGVNKINESKTNPQTKTTFNSVPTYNVPLIYACPRYWGLGQIYPYNIIIRNSDISSRSTEYKYLCLTRNNGTLVKRGLVDPIITYENYQNSDRVKKFMRGGTVEYACEALMKQMPGIYNDTTLILEDYNNIKDASSWTILRFKGSGSRRTDSKNVHCWALIPPTNYPFSHSIAWHFGWVPSNGTEVIFSDDYPDPSQPTSQQTYFGIEYNIVHPDYTDDWYESIQETGVFDSAYQIGYSTSSSYFVALWESTSISISLNSKTSLSGHTFNYYETYFKSAVQSKGTLTYAADVVYIDENTTHYVPIPQFMINIEANTMLGNGDRNSFLYHRETVEYQDYTFTDFLSGIGGILSLTLQIFGMITGILLTAQYIPSSVGWKGFAPYPPFDELYQVRLRRFINKEMKQL